jgi:F-type H+-transporting ATPase subunit delta
LNETPVSLRYAKALLGAAEEKEALNQVRDDIQGILQLIGESKDLRDFLADPLIHSARKEAAFKSLFSDKVNDLTLGFLLLLCEKRRERALEGIGRALLALLDERRGVITAQVRSAQTLSEAQQVRLSERLSAYSGKEVRLDMEVDEGLKAGFVARLGDQVFDGSLDSQLSRLRRGLAAGV